MENKRKQTLYLSCKSKSEQKVFQIKFPVNLNSKNSFQNDS